MNKFKKIFKSKKPFVIGMVHCAPLLGYKESPGIKETEKKFMHDLKVLVGGGVDAIMIENNYDVPHYEKAKPSTVPQLADLCIKARRLTKKPLGLCVLWNDYETALSIAKIADFQFVRIAVFVDKVKTDYGIFAGKAEECLAFRKEIGAEDVLIFADVQVKHAKHLIRRPLCEAVEEAVKSKADAIIITGKWTGDQPTEDDVLEAEKASGKIPVVLGSGITPENINKYSAEGFIVGTYFKGDIKTDKKDYHNIFPWKARNKKNLVRKFMKAIGK
ncbi:MAG: BtpA/SgcQ family protein [Leadbetterella sp.]|nr:BtpA/SgcQ family protein [Leadbetterella sp.]